MYEIAEYIKFKYGLPMFCIEEELLQDLQDLGYTSPIDLGDLADIWYEFYA